MGSAIVVAGVLLILVGSFVFRPLQKESQLAFIKNYTFSAALSQRVQKTYPQLNDSEVTRVMDGLREYFILCAIAKHKMVAMPSQVVDVAWHEFILFTREYAIFCRQGLGRFLHHTPTEAMKSKTVAQEGLKRAWRLSCQRENIDPGIPAALPILFALDAELKIADGFHYSLNCMDSASKDNHFCAGHIGCGGGCAGDSGGDFDSSHGCGGDGGGSSCGGD